MEEIPRVSRQPVSVDYLEKEWLQNQNFEVALTYNQEKEQFVTKSSQNNLHTDGGEMKPTDNQDEIMKTSTIQFRRAVEVYRQRYPGTKIDLDRKDFAEVVALVQKVEQKYYSTESSTGKVRNVVRKFTSSSKSIRPFLELLPDGAYKPLCGGLQLVVGAMTRHTEVRETIIDLLAEMPELAEDATNFMWLYQEPLLKSYVEEIYIAMIGVLEQIVHWYNQGSIKRASKALLGGSEFGRKIDDNMKALKRARERFDKRAQFCLHESVHKLLGHAKASENLANRNKEMLDGLIKDFGYSMWMQTLTYQSLNSAHEKINNLTLLAESFQPSPQSKKRITLPDGQYWTASKLISKLKLFLDKSPADAAELSIRKGQGANLSFQSRSYDFVNAPPFWSWLRSSESAMLLLEGRGSFERMSPLTYMMSVLGQRLAQESKILTLSFFCGLCSPSGHSACLELVRSMLSQILAWKGFSSMSENQQNRLFAFIDDDTIEGLQERSRSCHMDVLRQLVNLLRGCFTAVVILIDGIDHLESNDSTQAGRLYSVLEEMVEADQDMDASLDIYGEKCWRGVVKVLCSASSRSTSFPRRGNRIETLQLPQGTGGGRTPFNPITFGRSVERRDFVSSASPRYNKRAKSLSDADDGRSSGDGEDTE